ncbi:glycoside hydrolase family 16 protein [Thermosporothrix hazakensis]|nr:glycoside hydrolase family 16 protein [Thermosporothrix hazakensis]
MSVSDGALHLRTVKEDYTPPNSSTTYHWTSGMVTTDRIGDAGSSRFAFTYGYMEIRAWLAGGNGVYNAFWTGAEDHSWPPEIDALELLGDRPTIDHMTYHRDDNGKHVSLSQDSIGADFTAGWHTFGVDWQPGLLIWYVDGQEVTREIVPTDAFAKNLHLLLSAEIWKQSGWTNGPDDSTPSVSQMDVDYVRVWQREGDPSDPSPELPIVQPTKRFGTPGNGESTYEKATDGDVNTAFDAVDATNCATGIDVGEPTVVNTVRYVPRLYAGQRMPGGQFQGANSEDGPWTTLFTVPYAPNDGDFTTARFVNSVAYQFYRYVGPPDGHCNIAEMQFRNQ